MKASEDICGTNLSTYGDNLTSDSESLGSLIFSFSIRYFKIRRLVPSSDAALVWLKPVRCRAFTINSRSNSSTASLSGRDPLSTSSLRVAV